MAKPKIRFKGYQDDWEQRKVSEYASFFTGNGLNWNDVSHVGEQECILYGNLYTDYGMITEHVVYRTNTEIKNPVYSEYGDVLIPASDTTPTGLARATSLEKSGVLLGGDINIVRPNKGINGSCLSLALNANKKELIRLIKGTTVRHIHNSEIKDIVICLPKLENEQVRISSYFKQLDHLITLHQRKCDEAKKLKKFMLQKMFPQNGSLVPEIRFDGFTDDWEQRKLGEVCSRVQGNDGRMDLPILTISAANGWMKQEDRFSGNIAGREQKNYTLLQKGELSYNHGNSKLAKYGTVFSLQSYEEALVPRVYHSFKVEMGNADFLEYYFATKLPDKELGRLISSGARMDGLLNIGYDEFMGIQMMFPSTKEQDRIADYFRNLDHLITLHQQKCDDLKNLKKYMLQNMFV